MTANSAGHRDDTALRRFNRTAEIATTDVIRTYSTSFGLATRLLGKRHRQHVRNIYAMVRIADEIVDGVAAEALMRRHIRHIGGVWSGRDED